MNNPLSTRPAVVAALCAVLTGVLAACATSGPEQDRGASQTATGTSSANLVSQAQTIQDKRQCRDRLSALQTGPIYTPPSLKGTVFYPSNLGGNNSGEILWQIPFGTLKHMAPWPVSTMIEGALEMGGPIVTASGLVFIAAASDGYFRAYDTNSGAELWRTELPATGNAVPMTYVHNGEQFVVIAAGGHFTSPLPSGDDIMAYRLPKKG